MSVLTDIEDVTDILRSSDVFFFPSLNEGFGIVALEAAAAGLPVVATRLPTIEEALSPLSRQFTFASNDDDSAIYCILSIVHNRSVRKGLSNDSLQWASEWSKTDPTSALTTAYRSRGRSRNSVTHLRPLHSA